MEPIQGRLAAVAIPAHLLPAVVEAERIPDKLVAVAIHDPRRLAAAAELIQDRQVAVIRDLPPQVVAVPEQTLGRVEDILDHLRRAGAVEDLILVTAVDIPGRLRQVGATADRILGTVVADTPDPRFQVSPPTTPGITLATVEIG